MQQLSPSEEMFFQAWKLKNPGDHLVPHFYFPEVNYRVQFAHPASRTAVILESAFADQKTPDVIAAEQQKEFDLQNRGWNFLRFSTDEVYNSPERCVAVLQDNIRRHNQSTQWGYNPNQMPGGMYPMPPTPYGQPTMYGQPNPYGQPYTPGGYNQPTMYGQPNPYVPPNLPPPTGMPMQQGMYQFQYQSPYSPMPYGHNPNMPPMQREGYKYTYDPVKGWLEKRPYPVWVYFVLPLFGSGIGVFIALMLGCFKEPNPTGRTIARVITALAILGIILAVIV